MFGEMVYPKKFSYIVRQESLINSGKETQVKVLINFLFSENNLQLYNYLNIGVKERRNSSLLEISFSLKSDHVFTGYKLLLSQ